MGDELGVVSEGTGAVSHGEALDDRLKLPANDPGRDIVVAVVDSTPTSCDEFGNLTGDVRISDFVSIHLDGIVDQDNVDPKDPSKMITIRNLMGTMTNRRVETS